MFVYRAALLSLLARDMAGSMVASVPLLPCNKGYLDGHTRGRVDRVEAVLPWFCYCYYHPCSFPAAPLVMVVAVVSHTTQPATSNNDQGARAPSTAVRMQGLPYHALPARSVGMQVAASHGFAH